MKFPVVIASFALFLSSCNKAELDKAKSSNDSLMSVVIERDAVITEFISAFNDVEQNLDSVAVRQHIIAKSTDQKGEISANQKSKINAEITAINSLMDENRRNLSALSKKLKNSSHKNAQLEKAIATLNDQLAQKDVELTALNEKLNNLNAQVVQLQTNVTSLSEENMAKAQTISEETKALHTAYYVVGKTKDLQEAKLIDRKGGMLGMGKTSKISADVDNDKFTRIDYTQTTNIKVNGEKAHVVTSHPTDSYVWDKDVNNQAKVNNLVITNPEKFWSSSKYLVIVKD